MFWLVQKSTLLAETPLYLPDKTINIKHFAAASNIFEDMLRCQALPSKKRELVEDEVLWYFLELERAALLSDDDLYELSDSAKDMLLSKKGRDKVERVKVGPIPNAVAPRWSGRSSLSLDMSSVSQSEDASPMVTPRKHSSLLDTATESSDSLSMTFFFFSPWLRLNRFLFFFFLYVSHVFLLRCSEIFVTQVKLRRRVSVTKDSNCANLF